ncbi:TPA: hypothetical protein QFP73_002328 [Enterococcus faecium]|uniref:hypothetical protein n=1 Tax=Enterococcus durans TaxID=53345 RepID=UPI001C8B63A4|nr:hypothetical protein [Enterococcus durans]MBX9042125.1 hypothetical protein [Enterococcus durans]MBX9078647.1 hypothetical protein [Enterococcus durans]MDT2772710.1 hypothetical protein [Enterococcus durans]
MIVNIISALSIIVLLLTVVNQSNEVKYLKKENKVLKGALRKTEYSYVADHLEDK